MLPCWGRGLVPRPKSMENQRKRKNRTKVEMHQHLFENDDCYVDTHHIILKYIDLNDFALYSTK
jgi:hypothetical protein